MEITGLKDTISWYDNNASDYSRKADDYTFDEQAKTFLEHLPESPTVLDAGCGNGRDTNTLHKLGARASGLDLSKGLLEVAEAKYPDIKFQYGSFTDLPYENNSHDGVWSHASLVHLDTIVDVEKSLVEFSRILKPGGLLYIRVKKQTGENETEVASDILSNHDRFFRYYTESQLEDLLSRAGFIIKTMDLLDDPHGRDETKWIRLFATKK